jgi:16S rRNA (guanine527-N7)-methyltransferase
VERSIAVRCTFHGERADAALSGAEPEPGSLLAEGLETLRIALGAGDQRRLVDLAELLAQWAQRLNLTAHRTPQAIVRRLILDAAALEQQIPNAARVADLGSGAGFPGLPLAVLRPTTRFVLIEARERRHHFQRTAIRRLELSNVEVRQGRIETLEVVPADGVVAQALTRPRDAVELALRWAAPGGWIALPGSETPPMPGSVAGIDRAEIRTYRVPCGGPARTLWLGWRA